MAVDPGHPVNLTWKDVSQPPYNGSLQVAINGNAQAIPPVAPVQRGDTIYVPGGTYNVTASLSVNQSNVRIVGDGIDRTIVNCLGDAGFPVFSVTASFVTLLKRHVSSRPTWGRPPSQRSRT